MGAIWKIAVVMGAAALFFKFNQWNTPPPLPHLYDVWWGPGQHGPEDTTIRPFQIQIKDEVIADLKQRIKSARPLTAPLEGIQHQYGLNTNLLRKILDYWTTKYNWRDRQTYLNQFPQYKTKIQGLDIHFLHVKPKNPGNLKVYPLLLLHGWPGSVREFYELIPLLTEPQKKRNFVFEVIVPSLPGYGFSEAAAKPGLGVAEMSVIFKNLMKRLKYDKYYLQGGDWGAAIVQSMAVLYPENVLGVHSNMCFINTAKSTLKMVLGSIYPPFIVDKEHESKMYPLSTILSNMVLESGYMHLQSTKPDTIGAALNDSPVGLAAYILEKFITWTNPAGRALADGKLTQKYTYDTLLDNVMIYWVTNSITTSMRLYSESFSKDQMTLGIMENPVLVPSGCARFSYELVYQSTALLNDKYARLVHIADYEGGHFAALELPHVLGKDIYDAVEKMVAANEEKKE